MKLQLILILQFFLGSVFGQILDDRYKNNLMGPVKECGEMAFSPAIKNGKLTSGNYIPHWSRGTRLFDGKGNVIEFQTHPDTVSGEFEKTTLAYDGTGCLKEIKFFTSSRELDRHFLYTCDGSGNIVQEIDYDFNVGKKPVRIYTYKYVSNRLVEIDDKGHGDAMSSKETFGYDKNNFLIRKESSSALESSINEYENDQHGRPTVEYILLKDNSRRIMSEFKYNDKGLVVEQVMYFRGRKSGAIFFEYSYDDYGNWTSKVELMSDEGKQKIPNMVTIRKIKYY